MKLKDLYELDIFPVRRLVLEDKNGKRPLQPVEWLKWYDNYTEIYYSKEAVMNAPVIGVRGYGYGNLEVILRF